MKTNRLRKYILSITLLLTAAAIAAPIDDAKRLYRNGQYEKAIEKLRVIVKRSPRDGTANYYLGAALMALGRSEEAVKPLEKAVSRGVADASRILAQYALDNYRLDEASENMDQWEEQLKKDKKDLPPSFSEMSRKIISMRNMLDRVERIEILDSISADSADFFKVFRLSKNAGSILPEEGMRALGVGTPGARLSSAFVPEYRNRVIWSESDADGIYSIHGASILDDGSIEQASVLDGNLGEGGSALFPFLMPDGATLYFANNGENSIGGYDIFMTRQNDDGSFYTPQNMGFPYNSKGNDYMLAIDESAGLGWLVTDRNAPEGKVTIYIFTPSQMRVNVDPSDPKLLSYALLDDISITRDADKDYADILQSKLPEAEIGDDGHAAFVFDAGNGKVYTQLQDFQNRKARAEMLKYLAAQREFSKHIEHENNLRMRYGKGEKALRKQILASEALTEQKRAELAEVRNNIVKLENNIK